MERSPINHGVSPAPQPGASTKSSAHADSWTSPENSAALLDLMHDLLGEHAEPDPLFFVETWTVGIEAAAQNFHARHQVASHPDANASAMRAFDFSVPLIFVFDGSDFPSVPAHFSAAWKNAYGVSPSSSSPHSAVPHDEAPRSTPAQTLTTEEACRLLGLAPNSNRKQIKNAYRQMVWRYHPDRLIHSSEPERRLATERMTAINQAYRLLCDPPSTASN